MPVIEAGDGTVTHINVFSVTPSNQQALVDSLTETVQAASTVPGWISASIHKSVDGSLVTNYVQFESREAAQAVLRHLAAGGYLQRNMALATSVAPGQYDVVFTLQSED